MRANLILVPSVLIDVGRNQNGEFLLLCRQRDGTPNLRTSAAGRFHNLLGRRVNQTMVKGLQPDSDTLVLHTTSP